MVKWKRCVYGCFQGNSFFFPLTGTEQLDQNKTGVEQAMIIFLEVYLFSVGSFHLSFQDSRLTYLHYLISRCHLLFAIHSEKGNLKLVSISVP